jgi:hypothetical protein
LSSSLKARLALSSSLKARVALSSPTGDSEEGAGAAKNDLR